MLGLGPNTKSRGNESNNYTSRNITIGSQEKFRNNLLAACLLCTPANSLNKEDSSFNRFIVDNLKEEAKSTKN